MELKKKAAPLPAAATAEGQHQNTNNSNIAKEKDTGNGNSLEIVSMQELYEQIYPPKTPVIEGLLYPGMYFFVGAPKVGKSFFMAQLAYHVASGLSLWNYPVRQGSVLYLALEDDYARLQKRLSRMFDVEGSAHLFMAVHAKTIAEGLEYQVESFLKGHTDARLVIIDTMQRIRDIGSEQYSYASDYEVVNRLKALADRNAISLLIVHHTRKMGSEDSFDMISGTNGLLGAADGAFMLQKKKRTDREATLSVVGRDQQEQELTLEFDPNRCFWNFVKAETELWKSLPDPLLEKIVQLLPKTGTSWSGSSSELLDQLRKIDPEINLAANALSRKLNVRAERLFNDFGIRLESSRNHEGRQLKLVRE